MIKAQPEQERNIEWKKVRQIIKEEFGIYRIYTRASLIYVKSKCGYGTVGAEIGVWTGDLSCSILSYMKPEKLYLIDSWAVYPDYIKELKSRNFNGEYLEQDRWDNMYRVVCDRYENNKLVNVIRNMSSDAAEKFNNEELDWVYIDASHIEKYVYKDLFAWWPKIKSGGTLCGHDFLFPGVSLALRKFSKKMNLIVWPCGNDWWIDKK